MLCIVTGRQTKEAGGWVHHADSAGPPSPQDLSHSRALGAGVSTLVLGRRRHLTGCPPSPVFQPFLSISSCCLDPTCCSQPCNPARPDDGSSLLQRQQLKQIYCNELILLRSNSPWLRVTPLAPSSLARRVPRACIHLTRRLLRVLADSVRGRPRFSTPPVHTASRHPAATTRTKHGSYGPGGSSQCWASLGFQRGLTRPDVLCRPLQPPWIPTSSVL